MSVVSPVKQLRVGQTVGSKHGTAKVRKIELCEKPGDKYGIKMNAVWLDLLDRVVVDLYNDNWSIGSDLTIGGYND